MFWNITSPKDLSAIVDSEFSHPNFERIFVFILLLFFEKQKLKLKMKIEIREKV